MAESPDSVVVMETTQGTIEIQLKPRSAPEACANFLGLVEKGYYNGTPFHRIIKGFMIQGGDPTGTGRGGKSLRGGDFDDEFSSKEKHDKPGVVSMANAGPNTNRSQFFITTAPAEHLDGRHTIFGFVSKGYDVVEKLELVKTGAQDRPLEEQKILRAHVKH